MSLTGKLPGKFTRKVVLQRLTKKGWKKVSAGTTTRKGHFTLTAHPTKTHTYRVRVPAGTYAGEHRVKRYTKKIELKPVHQSIQLVRTADEQSVAIFSPTRKNRTATLWRNTGSGWKAVGKAIAQGSNGKITFDTAEPSSGTWTYRVVAAAYHRAASQTSATLSIAAGSSVGGAAADRPNLELASQGAGFDAAAATGTTSAISRDGGRVAFLAPATGSGTMQVFVRDRDAGTTVLASHTSGGAVPNAAATDLAISPSGRYVAFSSTATNIVAFHEETTNPGRSNVYLVDTTTGAVSLVSHISGFTTLPGAADSTSPSVSEDGEYVTFTSSADLYTNGATSSAANVYLWRRAAPGIMQQVSQTTAGTTGNGASTSSVVSADGRYVAFASTASNLVSGDSNGVSDVFLWDRTAPEGLARISTNAGGGALPDISTGGGTVVYVAGGSVYRYSGGAVSHVADGVAAGFAPSVNGDGTVIAWASTGGQALARNMVTDAVAAAGGSSGTAPSLSADGNTLSFATAAVLTSADHDGAADIYAYRVR